MVLLRLSFNLFQNSDSTFPRPRIESLTSLLAGDGLSKYSCSCEQVQNNRSVVRKLGPNFSFLLLNEQSLEDLMTEYAAFSSKNAGLLSQDQQEDLLFRLKTHCSCGTVEITSAVVSLPSNEQPAERRPTRKRTIDEIFPAPSKKAKVEESPLKLDRGCRTAPAALKIFRQCSGHSDRRAAINKGLLGEIKADVNRERRGRIYILQSASKPGFVKIGSTRAPLALSRLQELRRCFNDLTFVKQTTDVLWPIKIERLVAAEFVLHRKYQDCAMCGTQHNEWFEIDALTAEKVIQRWSNWVNKQPYDSGTRKLRTEWHRRSEIKALLSCEPGKYEQDNTWDEYTKMEFVPQAGRLDRIKWVQLVEKSTFGF
ncbi:hypothetical protein PMZ80_002831 [Knufia obscura]|uniref:Bacteriophage T5 Orf172 DNA-binding domain-containing protein n=1 Tax=Knufia obscura TaxID=1635080 RepID=A0ABR0RYH0_9EURO|nr:hypothetical protein PMZ80_002831 [Knufia obscura]